MLTPETVLDRLRRPQRVGVFGHRAVGKTTLLTVLYREAVGGRLPGLRLAAADARTADYLADKIVPLESGRPLPATLAETDLRFHLYHDGACLDLLFKDYQGEHVEVGRREPVRDFLRDCDAVWLCLDAGALADAAGRLRREQEVEQAVEDYLSGPGCVPGARPTALVLTKADRLGPTPWDAEALAFERLGMTRHALTSHFPSGGVFAVSSFGPAGHPGTDLSPANLHEPLVWLAETLQAQDEARLDALWSAGASLAVLEKAVACFARRYPSAAAARRHQQRLEGLRRSRRRRRGLLALGTAACALLSLAAYDVLGYQAARRFEAGHGHDATAALARWEQYRSWHPTHGLFLPSADGRIGALAEAECLQKREARLTELRRQAADPDADPEDLWRRFLAFRVEHPEEDVAGDLTSLRASLKERRDAQLAARALRGYDALKSAEANGEDLAELLARGDRFLGEFAGTAHEADVRRLREACLARIDGRGIEEARAYSARHPFHFQTRREHYQRYLDRHPDGVFRPEAEDAVRAIEVAWDRHDFRAVRDHFLEKPGAVSELATRCRSYLAVHPRGAFVAAANDLLRWSETVTAPRAYKIVLKSGQVEKRLARLFSRGPDLSVEIEVAGVRYGPSPVVANRYDPEWDYEFARPVRWKLGDRVVIRVTDHDWQDRVVVEIASAEDDPLALRLLGGEASAGGNRFVFASDFALPALPPIE